MVNLGRIGLWTRELRTRPPSETREVLAELDSLGYGAIWMPAGSAETFFPLADGLLDATKRLAVVSGILSVWTNPPSAVAAETAGLAARHPDRFLLGLGVSHAQIVEQQTGRRYERPLTVMREYLDDLDRTEWPVKDQDLILAALGPKMLELSRDRSAGAHPYFVPVAHTRIARSVLGTDRLLAPEQAVVLESDPGRARTIARRHTANYLRAPNYVNNLRRLGYGDADLGGEGSDRLVDDLVAWGDVETVGRRLREHFDAGADHICMQVLPAEPDTLPLQEWRHLAELIAAA